MCERQPFGFVPSRLCPSIEQRVLEYQKTSKINRISHLPGGLTSSSDTFAEIDALSSWKMSLAVCTFNV
jgi:hypothetical protein